MVETIDKELRITNVGRIACLRNREEGISLRIGYFAVGDGTNYVPSSFQEDLVGSYLYNSNLTEANIRKDRKQTIVVECVVDENSTPAFIGEIGIFLESGELFAVGVFEPVIDKNSPYRLKIYCYLHAPGIGNIIYSDVKILPSIPKVLYYSNLPDPNFAHFNVYLVYQGHCVKKLTDEQDSPVLVAKKTDEWQLVSGSVVYEGKISFINFPGEDIENEETDTGMDKFKIPEDTEASKFIHERKTNLDYAMVSIVDGPGKYSCRLLDYDKEEDVFFLIDAPFEEIEVETSIIKIWCGPGCCGGTCYPVKV